MIPKRFSRVDELTFKIPLHAVFIRNEPDSDHMWYCVWTDQEMARIAKYYGIEEDLIEDLIKDN